MPFDSDRKLMSTVHPLPDGKFLVAVKGAPDQLLKRCVLRDKAGDIAPIDEKVTNLIHTNNSEMALKPCVSLLVLIRLLTAFRKPHF